MSPRPYQASAAEASISRNTLLVLPTGLGKTIVALLHVQAILSSVPAGVCVMMAPTKALLVQHRDLFQQHLAIPGAALAIVDGETTPDNRRTFYHSLAGKRVVLFMTPLTVFNDLEKGRLPRDAIVDLVVDEAHHATKGDPYALVYAYLREHHVHPRVLAMTASPGETERRIMDVCQNLGIHPADTIIKQRDDPEVAPFVHELRVKRYEMPLTPDYEDVRARLVAVLREPCAWLRSAGVAGEKAAVGQDSLSLPSWEALQVLADRHLAGASARAVGEGDEDPDENPGVDLETTSSTQKGLVKGLVSTLVLALRARHCVELVETQGFPALVAYHEKLVGKAAEAPSPSLDALLTHPQYRAAMKIVGKLVGEQSAAANHPKLGVLADLLAGFFVDHPASRCIVFTKFRASVPMLVASLSAVKGVIPRRFVGQATKSPKDVGMKRDEQQAVLRAFKAGTYNVLVATSVAEEGIDVAECDMVVFYEATPKVIQSIQRQGRAGRQRDGDVAILLATGTADQLNAAVLDEKLDKMEGIMYRVQHVRAAGMPEPRPAAITRMPAKQRLPSPVLPLKAAPPPSPVTKPSKPASVGSKQIIKEKPPAAGVKPSPMISEAQPPSPVLVHPWCIGAREIVAGLTAGGVVARLDGSIAPCSILLAGGVHVRVINTTDAGVVDAGIVIEELPGAARRVVAVCPDGEGDLDARLAGRLARKLVRHGIEVWNCQDGKGIASRVIASSKAVA